MHSKSTVSASIQNMLNKYQAIENKKVTFGNGKNYLAKAKAIWEI
jgi:hypothetical protein